MIVENIVIIRDFFQLVKGHKVWVFFLFVGSILGHFCDFLIPIFVSQIVFFVTNGDASGMYWNILFLFWGYIAYNFSWYLNYVSYTNNFRYSYPNLREKIMNQVFSYDVSFSDKISKGEILNTINSDVANLSEMIDNICEILVVACKLFIMIFLFLKTSILVGFLVLLFVGLYVKLYDYFNVCSTKYYMGQQRYRDKLTNQLSDILGGFREIKMFHLYDKMKRNFYILANKWSEQYQRKQRYCDIRDSLLPFVIQFGKVMIYFVLGYLTLKQKMLVSTLLLFVSYYEIIMEDSEDLMEYSRDLREWSVSIYRVKRLLHYSGKEEYLFGENETDQICGSCEFSHVSFQYPSKNHGAIHDVSFQVRPNEITAIVGRSGSGKTTVMNLLLRNYKIDCGNIFVDQDNIYHYSKKVYSKNVVGVNQVPFLFSMSIRQNLSFIDSNESHQIEACKRVGIHDYIMSLPKGYHTVLSENATNFSGGQRQLLAIARTLLSKAEILVFDEVTSSLDSVFVQQIEHVLVDLKQDHTIIMITHKKEEMKLADHVIVMDQGRVVGDGTHKELLKRNPYYQSLQNSSVSKGSHR